MGLAAQRPARTPGWVAWSRTRCEGMALGNLGLALCKAGRFDEAITACQDAAAIYRETGDRHSEGIALNNLGIALREVRRFDETFTACQDAAAIFRETGDRHSEGIALRGTLKQPEPRPRPDSSRSAAREPCRCAGHSASWQTSGNGVFVPYGPP
jgi:tetratricopeptide (TPR) repeat protein